MKKVMVFGVFDIFHEGHKAFFRQAKSHGNYLIAVLATDKNVEKLKGKKPLHNAEQRRQQLLSYVDEAVIGDEHDFLKPLATYKPDVICLGYDQQDYQEILQQYLHTNPQAKIIRLQPYHPEKYKSSYFRKQKEQAKEK